MATKRKSSSKRDAAPKVVNTLVIDGVTYSLGNLRKTDFSSLSHADTSIKSNTAVINQIVDLLKGVAASA